MELSIITKENKQNGKAKLPEQFSEEIRKDLIKRAVEALQSMHHTQYGADPRAGKKQAAKLSRRRRKYKASYGKGISRVPRKTMMRRGSQMVWVGAFAPGMVGGRRAFPPTSETIFAQNINNKERKKAIRSALAAVVDKKTVTERGHKAPEQYPFILSDDFEEIKTSKEIVSVLSILGLSQELSRSHERKIRAGVGKLRGRKYKTAKGPLIVLSKTCNALRAAKNIPGIDAIIVSHINAEYLAPGTHAGRLTLFTQSAIEKMKTDKLFM